MIAARRACSADDVEACLRLREEVFVREQGVPSELERDDEDAAALHFLAWRDGRPIATARVVLKEKGALAKIGRVAVLRPHRRAGVGRLLMAAIESAPELGRVQRFALDAQVQALPFYEGLGYAAYGEEFLEAGLAHRHMLKAHGKR